MSERDLRVVLHDWRYWLTRESRLRRPWTARTLYLRLTADRAVERALAEDWLEQIPRVLGMVMKRWPHSVLLTDVGTMHCVVAKVIR